MLKVTATITYAQFPETDKWTFDLDDKTDRIHFARIAHAALHAGATVTTRPAHPTEVLSKQP